MGAVYNEPSTGKVIVEHDDGSVVWTTDGRPVNILPPSETITWSGAIAFPNFATFVNYGYQTIFGSTGGDTCQTVVMIEPQTTTPADVVIGSVPPGVNYIDVRASLVQTKAPSTYLDDAVPMLIASGQQVHLPGGSCLLEATPIWRRLFSVSLSGTNIVLKRKQSVIDMSQVAPGGIYQNSNQDRGSHSGSANTWEGWGNNVSNSKRDGHPATLIQSKDFGPNHGASVPTNQAKMRGRERQCTMSHSYNYSSTYTGTITIRPGYIPS